MSILLVAMSFELVLQTLDHLSQAAKIVNHDNRTQTLLRCYYLSRMQSIAETANIPMEKPSGSSCTKCLTPFNDSSAFTLSIAARKIYKQKHKKLVSNLESRTNLSECKKNFAKKYQKLVYNVAKTTCKFCSANRKTCVRLDSKNKERLKAEKVSDPPIIRLTDLELVKPKKRKRDKNAGLKIKDKVFIASNKLHTKSIIEPIKMSTIQPIKAPAIQPIKMPAIQPIKIQAKPKTNDTKKSKHSSSSGVAKTKKISSAEKQRKSILLLANVLKMNDRQQDSSQMKLNKMFKK